MIAFADPVFSKKANAETWVAVTNPDGWTPDKTKALTTLLDSQPQAGE